MSSVAIYTAATPARAQVKSFDIPAQPVETAIGVLGLQAKAQIGAARAFTRGKRANAVQGAMTTEEALRRMLKGTGLRAQQINPQSYVILEDLPVSRATLASETGVPVAEQATIATPAATTEPAVTGAGDEASAASAIVVLGVRGAQRAAVAVKRQAPQIVDSIVAEDIGKLPDVTIADSLQRVPGIQIGRSAGEGSSVNIRGLQQVLVTLNGEQFLGGSAIDGAQPNFQDIPSTLFSGVDVYKSVTAKQVEGGVSGIIDLKSRRPFDLHRGLTLSGEAQGDYGSRVKTLNGSFSGLAGWRGERFAVLVAGSYSDSRLANDSINTGNSWRATAYGGTPQGFYYQPSATTFSDLQTRRRRYGIDGSVQYKVTDSLTFTGDLFYTRLDNRDESVGIQYNSNGALPLQGGSIVTGDGVATLANYNLGNLVIDSNNVFSRSQALNSNVQLDYDNGGRFRASLRWARGRATRNSSSAYADAKPVVGSQITRGTPASCRVTPAPASCVQFANPNGLAFIPGSVDFRPDVPSITLDDRASDPAYYDLQSTWGFGDRRVGEQNAYRLDASYRADWSILKSIDFGARYQTRDVSVESYRYLSPVTVDGLGLLNGPGDLYYYKDPQIGHTGRPEIAGRSVLPLYSFASIPNLVRNFTDFIVPGVPGAGIPAVDPAKMGNVVSYLDGLFPGNQPYVDPTNSFRVTERSLTGYVQANYEGELGLPFSGNVGVRVVHTRRAVYANTTNAALFIGTGGNYNGVFINQGVTRTNKDYTRVLPDFNLTVNTFENQKLRVAVAKVVGVLNLFNLGQGQSLSYRVNNGQYPNLPSDLQVFNQGSSGNPNLEPFQSTNYNASYEFYFGHGGILSAAAFLFDVKSFPQTVNQIEPIADQDGVVRAGGTITTFANGVGGKIKGIELGYQQQFDFLPGILSGLGAQANYTFSSSESSNRDLYGKGLPVPDNSKHQFNLVGIYQKGKFQGRVAYNWRSDRFVGLQPVNGTQAFTGNAATQNLAIFSRPVGYLDASASYDLIPNVTFFVQGTNLTKAFDRQYAQFKDQFYAESVFERRVTFGVRIRN